MAVDRITAAKVQGNLDDHQQFHELKLNPKVHNHHIVLFGEKGDDGLCRTSGEHTSQILDLQKDVTKITDLTEKLSKAVLTSEFSIKIGTWIVSAFGLSVIGLIWALITGKASLIFK